MPYDEDVAQKIRDAVGVAAGDAGYRETRMFGGLCWTVNTHMAVGAVGTDLMVHVGTDGISPALEAGARRATMGERQMGGVVLVSAADLEAEGAMASWVEPAVARALARPPKQSRKPSGSQTRTRAADTGA